MTHWYHGRFSLFLRRVIWVEGERKRLRRLGHGRELLQMQNTFKKKKKIKSKIEFKILYYGKGRNLPSRDPGERCKNKPVATETCSQHLLLYSQPNKYKYGLRQYKFDSNRRQRVLEVYRQRKIFEVIHQNQVKEAIGC